MAVSLWAIAVGLLLADPSSPPPQSLYSPVVWSPSGNEIAWIASAGDEESVVAEEWVFPGTASTPQAMNRRTELWVGRVDDGSCWRISSTPGQFCTPCWSADGQSLFIVRWEARPQGAPGGVVRLERHLRDGGLKVLVAEEVAAAPNPAIPFTSAQGSAAADGLVVAMPWLPHPTTLVYSVERGAEERRLAGAEYPSWRPAGDFLAVFQRTEGAPGIQVYRRRYGEERKEWTLSPLTRIATPYQMQPVDWDPSGDTFVFLRAKLEARNALLQPEAEIARASATEGNSQKIASRGLGEVRVKEPACYFAFDRRREALQLAFQTADDSRVFTRKELDQASGQEAGWHPLDDAEGRSQIPLGVPAFSPKGDLLAFRYGGPEWNAAVAVWNTKREQIVTFAPNRSMRLRALRALTLAAKRLIPKQQNSEGNGSLRNSFRTGIRNAGSNLRIASIYDLFPTVVAPLNGDAGRRAALERIAVHGLELVRLQDRDDQASADVRRKIAEAAVLFHWTQSEFGEVLRRLQDLEPGDDSGEKAEHRLAFQILRLDCLAALGARKSVTVEATRLHRLREEELKQSPRNGKKTTTAGGIGGLEDLAPDPHLRRLERLLQLPPISEDGSAMKPN